MSNGCPNLLNGLSKNIRSKSKILINVCLKFSNWTQHHQQQQRQQQQQETHTLLHSFKHGFRKYPAKIRQKQLHGWTAITSGDWVVMKSAPDDLEQG